MTVKVGERFLSIYVDDEGKISWDEHIVRTIRGGYVYAIQKETWTWGKRSTRTGDFGWLDPIDPHFRTKWRVGAERPARLSKTRTQAIRYAIEHHERYSDPEDYEDPKTFQKVTETLQRMLKREQNKRKNTK